MKMEVLNNSIIEKNSSVFKNTLVRVVDMLHFEGPLLTLFENPNHKTLYLLDWVDRDASANRWLIYRCNVPTLTKFIKSKISHNRLFFADEPICRVVDIDVNLEWIQLQIIDKKDLPTSYYPAKDAFFEKADCPQFAKLQQFLTTPRTMAKPNILRKDKALTGILGLIRGTLTPAEAYYLIENQSF
jgi:hypothetical protein